MLTMVESDQVSKDCPVNSNPEISSNGSTKHEVITVDESYHSIEMNKNLHSSEDLANEKSLTQSQTTMESTETVDEGIHSIEMDKYQHGSEELANEKSLTQFQNPLESVKTLVQPTLIPSNNNSTPMTSDISKNVGSIDEVINLVDDSGDGNLIWRTRQASSSSSNESDNENNVSQLPPTGCHDDIVSDADEDDKVSKQPPRTKGEFTIDDLPPVEYLSISADEKVDLKLLGDVSTIVDKLVLVQSLEGVRALDEDSLLFFKDRTVFGQVFETLGRVKAPYYSVRFNSSDDVKSRNITSGTSVYYAPQEESFSKFVLADQMVVGKGSDASWKDNNEPPVKFLDFSDDEDERRAKGKSRKKTTAQPEENNTPSDCQIQRKRTYADRKQNSHRPPPVKNSSNSERRESFPGNWFASAPQNTVIDPIQIDLTKPPPINNNWQRPCPAFGQPASYPSPMASPQPPLMRQPLQVNVSNASHILPMTQFMPSPGFSNPMVSPQGPPIYHSGPPPPPPISPMMSHSNAPPMFQPSPNSFYHARPPRGSMPPPSPVNYNNQPGIRPFHGPSPQTNMWSENSFMRYSQPPPPVPYRPGMNQFNPTSTSQTDSSTFNQSSTGQYSHWNEPSWS